jgi:hypothetical protein
MGNHRFDTGACETPMHPAAKFGFERAVGEFARWRAVESEERSPAPAWWWDPALTVLRQSEPMPAAWSQTLGLPSASSYATGAQVLLNLLAEQTQLPWPDDFPRRYAPKDMHPEQQ